jgi:hypothetical protein
MNRTTIVTAFVSCLLFIQWHSLAYAQQETVPTEKPTRATHMQRLKWEKADGTEVLKVWKLEGKELFPQVSLMRVSDADYAKFKEKPESLKQFVNAHQIFSKPIITLGAWISPSGADATGEYGWTLTLLHGKVSTMLVSALPNFKKERNDAATKGKD